MAVAQAPSPAGPAGSTAHEVWVIDQSDTSAAGGGTLFVHDGQSLAGRDAASASPQVLDLGGAANTFCLAATGTTPRRPHMIFFNPTHSHAVISYVATGHVLFMGFPVGCVDVGAQAHAAVPSPDGSYVVVANQNGKLLFSYDGRGFVDSHGTVLVKEGFLWAGDRAANRMVVVDTATDTVVNEIELACPVSGDPAPDLLGVFPNGNRVYVAFRGPNPLTANVPGLDNAVGSTPGVGVVRVRKRGTDGTRKAIARISHVVDGVERADPHGIAVRVP